MRFHPVGQRAGAAQRLVEANVRLPIGVGVALADVHVEVGVDFVDEPDGFAGELAGRALQRTQVSAQIVGALLVESVAPRHVRQGGDQPTGLPAQIGRIGFGLVRYPLAQCGIAGEGVDIARLDPVETQTEKQVLTDQRVRVHAV
jgi:hypothetical protein